MKETKEIKKKEKAEVIPPSPPLITSEDNLLEIVKVAEQRLEAFKKLKYFALKITDPQDWVDFEGNPYLQASGAEKVARLFGISWKLDDYPQVEKKPNGHYRVITKGTFWWQGSTIEVIGIRESDDPFFATRYREGQKIELPPDEVDLANVIRASESNCIEHGVMRMLGLRNLSWEELEKYGIKRPQKSVSFKKSEPPQPQPQSEPEPKTIPLSEVQIKYIEDMTKKKGTDIVALETHIGKSLKEWTQQDFVNALKYLQSIPPSEKK